MTYLAQREPTSTHPTPAQATTFASTPASEEGDLMKYVKELEGKGRNPTELLCLLQLTVEADEKDEVSF